MVKIASVKIIKDKLTGKGKGYGFIEMPDDTQAKSAIEELNGAEIDGRPIVVNKSEIRKDDNKRSNFSSNNKTKEFGRNSFNKPGNYNKSGYNKSGNNSGGNKNGIGRRASY